MGVVRGGGSSTVESRIVIPVVVGSNPIRHPIIKELRNVSKGFRNVGQVSQIFNVILPRFEQQYARETAAVNPDGGLGVIAREIVSAPPTRVGPLCPG
jgi:hypothetical protein